MEAKASYPGSMGEIIQGNIGGQDMLVSCPVNLYTEVKVFESKKPEDKYKNAKTAKFLENMLRRWDLSNYETSLDINITSQIPRGKGFASSTADLCALYRALLQFSKRSFNKIELIEECIAIEPTDSIIFSEMTLFDYKTGRSFKALGSYMSFHILVFEGCKSVDTVEFNRRRLPPQKSVEDLLPLLKSSIAEGNIKKLAAASTESIIRNQHRLRYDYLNEVLEICNRSKGLGVIGAHSGDSLGIIFEDNERLKYVHDKINRGLYIYDKKNNLKVYALKTVSVY